MLKPKEVKNYFAGRAISIATKHNKESVIAPILNSRLGMVSFTPSDIDTDLLGTFSGEVERIGNPIDILREKCTMAMDFTGHDVAVASEGTFGPHPYIPFVYADEEIILLSDRRHDLEVVVKKISTITNFAGAEISSLNELIKFAKKALFPLHGIILKRAKNDFKEMRKGIKDWNVLNATYHQFMDKHGTVYAETDMRANMNPLRMNLIRNVSLELVKKMKSKCPECYYPNFGITVVKQGLPCSQCATPTKSILTNVSECGSCGFRSEIMYPKGIFSENPMYCDVCNP
jgi:hypothetical protein